MTARQRLTLARILALLVVIVISVYVFSIRDQAKELAKYGLPGIFLLSILANATVLLPAPGILFVFTMGAVFPPIAVALAAGAGAAIGELSGYLAGFSGQGVFEKASVYQRINDLMTRRRYLSYLVILVLAFVPNPFFDLAGLSAGALKMSVWPFLFFTFIGKFLKMLMFALLGASAIKWIEGVNS
jgi:membrane protein YqaA with SNARE-associated domain